MLKQTVSLFKVKSTTKWGSPSAGRAEKEQERKGKKRHLLGSVLFYRLTNYLFYPVRDPECLNDEDDWEVK